jgi:hypothetical protein
MKVIRKAVWHACSECGSRKQVQAEAFGCEACGKPIDMALTPHGSHGYLEVTRFHLDCGRDADRLRFCSWACVFAVLPTIACDHFISLPFLLYDETQPGLRARDFFAAQRLAKEAGT